MPSSVPGIATIDTEASQHKEGSNLTWGIENYMMECQLFPRIFGMHVKLKNIQGAHVIF